jgi:hypothetical protein
MRFYLNEVLLGPLAVYASAQCVSRKIAGQIVGFAGRYVRYTHVLRTEGDEIADRGIVEAFDIRAKELPPWWWCSSSSATGTTYSAFGTIRTLGEPDCVKAIRQ